MSEAVLVQRPIFCTSQEDWPFNSMTALFLHNTLGDGTFYYLGRREQSLSSVQVQVLALSKGINIL